MGQRQGAQTLRRRRARVRACVRARPGRQYTLTSLILLYKYNARIVFYGVWGNWWSSSYYEWLKKGTQRVPHFTQHKDKRLMLFAGLYDAATLEGE